MLVHSVYSRDPRVRRYAEYLAKMGHEVDVICLSADAIEQDPPYESIKIHPIILKRERKGGLWQAVEWFMSAFLMFLKLTRLYIKRRHNLIHVNNMPDFLVFSAIVPRLAGVPVILDVHDPIPELIRSKMNLKEGHWLVKVQKLLERLSVSFSSHVITATPTFARLLIQRGAPRKKVTVVMNAADPEIFDAESGKAKDIDNIKTFTLLYLGTVAQRYGLEIAVRALPLIREQIPGAILRIVTRMSNEGSEVERIKELAEDLQVQDMIRIDEPVPLELVPELMNEADLGIYPAIKDCHMDIALSLKIPEMMIVGLPVVSTRLTILEELFGENSILFFKSRDWKDFAEKVIELYKDPWKRLEIARQGKIQAGELSWSKQFEKYLEVMDSLLNQNLIYRPETGACANSVHKRNSVH